jgi:hypothetical protein
MKIAINHPIMQRPDSESDLNQIMYRWNEVQWSEEKISVFFLREGFIFG